MSEPAIQTRDLVRTYKPRGSGAVKAAGPVVALDGVSLDVPRGQFFGLLGPNGAGKTTLIKVLVTLLLPTEGSARVAGFDVVRQAQRVKERITMVSGGEYSGFGLLTVKEQLWMFSQFYGLPGRQARARIDELLEVVGLTEARNRRVSGLSTGMRQKMNLVRGLLPDPEILFLDEPTVGLDVGAARDIRAYVKEWIGAKPGRTVLLTTHYLAEAEQLCDRIAIIHRGVIVAQDTPAALRRLGTSGSVFVLATGAGVDAAALERLGGVAGVEVRAEDGRAEVRVHVEEDAVIGGVLGALAASGTKVFAVEKSESSLEDAFVRILAEPR